MIMYTHTKGDTAVTVYEFCTSRHLQTQRVLKYIKRNADLFEGHAVKVGKTTELDDEALRLLNEQYPLPPEVAVIPNSELQQQLTAATDYIIKLQQELIQKEQQLAKAQLDALMLEDRTTQLLEARATNADLQTACNGLQREIGELTAQLEAAEKAAQAASEEAERLRSRSLLERILNK